jgi:tRNA dimethylallyltransferase
MKQIAIVAPTASGKSALSLDIANKCNSYILSLDSLSVYKDIDIVSAKPSKDELSSAKHFGVDIVYPDEYFAVSRFIDEYQKAKQEAIKDGKNLIVVGGSSFYLKSMIDGLSVEPTISNDIRDEVRDRVSKDVVKEWDMLNSIDSEYMQNIKSTDSYRVEKALSLYLASNMRPTDYFVANPKVSVLKDIDIYEISIDRDILRERIKLRTKMMFDDGLLDEVKMLEQKYTREPQCFKAIGIKETFDYFDNKLTKDELYEKIVTNTARLAKRQRTFNKTQLNKKLSGSVDELKRDIVDYLS